MRLEDFVDRGTAAQKAVDGAIRKQVKKMKREMEARTKPSAEGVIKRTRDGLTRCRVCGCTEMEACYPPCGWQPGEADLCDRCHEMAYRMRVFIGGAHRYSQAALFREVERASARAAATLLRNATHAKGKAKRANAR